MAAAPVNSNLQAQPESPSERPKHTSSPSNKSKLDGVTVNGVDSIESSYFKELQRNLRNTVKKLNATAKVDAIIAENPGKSLDDLVAEKKINADQKAQALKKPALQGSIAQIEEQITHYKEFAAQYEQRLATQKTELERAHKEEVDAIKEKAVSEANESSQTDLRQRLLSLSKFLCAAATMRRSGDETSSLTRAFEGVLYQVYGGSHEAVNSMLKLIDGVDEKVVSVEGETLDITYGKVKQTSEEHAPTAEEVTTGAAPASDPTLSNAGYTELQESSYGTEAPATNEPTSNAASQPEQVAPPAQTLVGDAANPTAEANWNPNAGDSFAPSANTDGWVEVPRDPTETDTGFEGTPAAADTGDNVAAEASGNGAENVTVLKPQGGDGFEAVVHHQRQNSFRGRGRGGRGRDGFRGRGRGEFRGRGRGRGGRGRGGPNGTPATPPAGSQ
ncbi:hypothetical protein BDV23DRAFT_166838 [Aspergillus alliaceus]|uniref:YAG7-like dimerisation domain-containing protein n=1 Tax=Petromyces alliaceus TaxID=209559 RepID=A0A5N7BRF7_PETAA|nr:uncharacterized protein BDW43DRAFT_210829 [Aspergillus alliaceus]KAB8228726.1 hypothetical protein BDW43DRAFT_210829 [Aspergillus alliaceus]KAE8384414.1 hypothetical protein BDV23DRAFT_166838 [Aspergillus alliaceus]